VCLNRAVFIESDWVAKIVVSRHNTAYAGSAIGFEKTQSDCIRLTCLREIEDCVVIVIQLPKFLSKIGDGKILENFEDGKKVKNIHFLFLLFYEEIQWPLNFFIQT
jgi:hypothetical protein